MKLKIVLIVFLVLTVGVSMVKAQEVELQGVAVATPSDGEILRTCVIVQNSTKDIKDVTVFFRIISVSGKMVTSGQLVVSLKADSAISQLAKLNMPNLRVGQYVAEFWTAKHDQKSLSFSVID